MKPFINAHDAHTRRTFIRGAAKTFLGVSLLNQLQGGKALAVPGLGTSPLKQVATARNVIYLYMTGGMSHLDTWDPRPENKEVQGDTEAINTNVDGIRISENLPLMARQMDKVALINSMSSTNRSRNTVRCRSERFPVTRQTASICSRATACASGEIPCPARPSFSDEQSTAIAFTRCQNRIRRFLAKSRTRLIAICMSQVLTLASPRKRWRPWYARRKQSCVTVSAASRSRMEASTKRKILGQW